jgi:hypothetical protein
MIQVFGTRPAGAIWLGDQPYPIRNDCQAGQWKVGDDDFRGKEIEISILKIARFFGSLGKARDTFWMQIWFVPAPTCSSLPANTICLTYLKTRSLSQFSAKITELMGEQDPAEGIFRGSFAKHSNDLGNYYSVQWDWRSRNSDQEQEQLQAIADFLQSDPLLVDQVATRGMIPLEGLSAAEITQLIQSASVQQLLP